MGSVQTTEQILTDQFVKIFELPPASLSRDTHLVELGADSLLLFEMIAPIHKIFGVKLSVRQFFSELQTVNKLVAYIDERTQTIEESTNENPLQDAHSSG